MYFLTWIKWKLKIDSKLIKYLKNFSWVEIVTKSQGSIVIKIKDNTGIKRKRLMCF